MMFCTDEGSITYGGHNYYIREGSVLLTPEEAAHYASNVVPVYRDKMRECATAMRTEADVIERAPKHEAAPGTIDITPHPQGLRGLAGEFDRYAIAAEQQIAELQGEAAL